MTNDIPLRLLWVGSTITLPHPMKAQRRRELKANSLIWTLQGLPETIKKYQSQVSLGLVVIALAIVLIQYRIRTGQERLEAARTSLGYAADDLQRLRTMSYDPQGDGQAFMRQREEFFSDGLQQADKVLEKAPDGEVQMKAQALLDKGDLNFEMANFPELNGAATQPALRPAEPQDTLLGNASDAYNQAIQNYADQRPVVTAAHFGLAAVAEDRAAGGDPSQWDAARAQYQAVIDGDAEQPFKVLAKQRLQLLPQLQLPATIDLSATTQASSRK
jgi:type II secretory pathway pseudopilin PulG